MQMPFLVRSRNNGKTFELRVKHRRLAKPVYHTFDVQEDAQRSRQRAIAALVVARSLRGSNARSVALWSLSLRRLLPTEGSVPFPPSTHNLLDTVMNDVGNRSLADVDYGWAEDWIRAMKLERKLAVIALIQNKSEYAEIALPSKVRG
jgi:hypothetical protein